MVAKVVFLRDPKLTCSYRTLSDIGQIKFRAPISSALQHCLEIPPTLTAESTELHYTILLTRADLNGRSTQACHQLDISSHIISTILVDQASCIMLDKPSLLSLPVEIRLQVYSYLDHHDSPIVYPLSEPHGSQASYLLTCRQLRYEIQHDFFSNNVFAITFNPDTRTGSNKHPFAKVVHAMAGQFDRDDDFQLPTLGPDGQQESTDLRAFNRFSALGDDLKMMANLQLHVLHWHLCAVNPFAFNAMLPEYVDKCKEQLNLMLEALVGLQNMKGPLGLTKLTVVDNVPCKEHGWSCATGRHPAMEKVQARLLHAYLPLLKQASVTLGISIENVKYDFHTFHVIGR